MYPETAKPGHSTMEGDHKQKQFLREVKQMLNALTHGTTGTTMTDNGEENGIRIITLAGTNAGATFRGELGDDKSNTMNPHEGMLFGGGESDDELSTHVNSNFQSVNNSIMFGSSYTTNDPGVHMEISQLSDNQAYPHNNKPDRHARKGKKKERDHFKSDHQSQLSD
ncbi:hypothetical protein ACFE04_007274 [Oxalis oulophora]